MKRTVKTFFVAVLATFLVALFCVCAFSAWDGDETFGEYYEFADTETYFRYVVDEDAKKAKVIYIEEECETAFLPQTVRLWDDDFEENVTYTVTAIELMPEDPFYSMVFVPKTVTEIEGLGYWWDWDGEFEEEWYWDEEEEEYVSVDYPEEPTRHKIDSFVVGCMKGSYAEIYAKQNGFSIKYFEDISAADIKLSKTSFYYTDDWIEPDVTVTFEGKTLVQNKDYCLTYENNREVGTATVKITGLKGLIGETTKTFSITKVPASAVTAELWYDSYEYDGERHTPYVDVSYKDLWLSEGRDYSVSYSNNINPGTATVKLSFFGEHFSGTKTLTFKIAIPAVSYPEIVANDDSTVSIYWNWYGECTPKQFNIYRYDASQKKYVYIGKSKNSYTGFKDKNTTQLTKYTYQVRAMLTLNDKKYYGTPVSLSVTSALKQPKVSGVLYKNSMKIKWAKNSAADGYIVYRRTVKKSSLSGAKKLATLNKNASSYTDKTIKAKYNYYYTVKAYKKIGNKTYYSGEGAFCQTDTPSTILAGAKLEPRTSFKVYNTQGKKTTWYTYNISKRDQKVLKKFADKHFTKKMSREEKLRYTLNWINQNVIYATGDNWNKICNKGYADAVFTYKLGQCVQYNGAMAEMMAYLGYDAYLIQGYRGNYETGNIWQHFWCEVKINDRVYLMETGNYDTDGSWHYFLTPYSQTSGYVKNGKNLGRAMWS